MAYKPDKIVYDSATGSTFKQAFADARKESLKGGPKTFEWNGKKYGTALKGETKAKSKSKSEDKEVLGSNVTNSVRMQDIDNVRNLAGKALSNVKERRDIIANQEQAKLADLMQTGTGRAMMDKAMPRAGQKMKDMNDKVDAYSTEFNKRDKIQKDAGAARGETFVVDSDNTEFKRGGKVKKMASGGATKSAASRGDGIAQRGKTRGTMR